MIRSLVALCAVLVCAICRTAVAADTAAETVRIAKNTVQLEKCLAAPANCLDGYLKFSTTGKIIKITDCTMSCTFDEVSISRMRKWMDPKQYPEFNLAKILEWIALPTDEEGLNTAAAAFRAQFAPSLEVEGKPPPPRCGDDCRIVTV